MPSARGGAGALFGKCDVVVEFSDWALDADSHHENRTAVSDHPACSIVRFQMADSGTQPLQPFPESEVALCVKAPTYPIFRL